MRLGVHRRIASFVLGGAFIVASDGALAQTAADCRALLFVDGDGACLDPANPGPQGDIIGADDCFQQLVPDSEVRFFRAVTRLLRLAEKSDADGPDAMTFTDSLKEMLDQFGYSSDPDPDQCGLTADGRSLYHFTASLPAAGSLDGSISLRDSFLDLDLDAGQYLLAVASCCGDTGTVIGGSTFGGPFQAELGQGFITSSDEGDYRVTFGGNVSQTQVDGTLVTVAPGTKWTLVDRIPFIVSSPGRVTIDVLSWEFSSEFGVPVDLNGDGEFKFINSQILLFVDDGNLDVIDLVDSNDDARGRVLDDPPGGGDVQTSLDTLGVVAQLDLSIADLKSLDEQFSVTITPAERTTLGPPRTEPIVLDLGEARLLQTLLQRMKAKIALSSALDLDLDLFPGGDEIYNLREIDQLRIQQDVIDANPSLLEHRGDPRVPAAQAKSGLAGAIDAYLEASDYIRANAESRPNNMVSIEPADRSDEAELRFHLRALRRSLFGQAPLFCNGSPSSRIVRDLLNPVLGTSFDGRGMTLDLASYFDDPFSLRGVFPEITFDELHQPKNYIRNADGPFNAFPDPDFNGVLLPPVPTSDCDGDGVLDDGDGSGIVGDSVCTGGETTNCDDNALYTANGPQGGSCTAGSAASLGRICLADLDCGDGGVCSLGQEDSDGDGSGDVVDRCGGGAGNSGTITIRHGGPLFGGRTLLGTMLGTLPLEIPFFDEIEPGAGIVVGPVYEGVNVEFACGTCATASFDEAVPTIGDNTGPCGYTDGAAQAITVNDDPVCVRHVPSGRLYDLDLLSWRSNTGGSCRDADGGVSCEAAEGEVSYTRTLCPEPGSVLLALTALATLSFLRGRARQSRSRIR